MPRCPYLAVMSPPTQTACCLPGHSCCHLRLPRARAVVRSLTRWAIARHFQHYRQVAAHSPGHLMRTFWPKLNVSSVHTHADCHLQHSHPESRQEVLKQSPSYSHCSSCAAVSKQLALLSPCTHAPCPACLTSALNIVDQVPMCCAVCGSSVGIFDLVYAPPGQSLSSFRPSHPSTNNEDVVVLRIDNIPWAITPLRHVTSRPVGDPDPPSRVPALSFPRPGSVQVSSHGPYTPPALLSFLGVPSSSGARAHILLDRLGKTQCHAFIELPSSAVAGSVLRGEHRATPKLGDGRRARDVTLTLSSPAALMAALFDSPFGRPAPFLTGGAPAGTHTCNSELTVLISLIRTLNPRFVKTPSLPFYLLTSILSKIPADGDRHLLWTGGGFLYEITFNAIQILLAREHEEVDHVLTQDLMRTALSCRAFTADQLSARLTGSDKRD
ncbi:hypothetical protein B0H13DRAFT_2372832 [Mycena leptocephala]|nr:hypothetical protein B0H13DRAFT_2372832 [Mycena leptocephala]